MYMKKNISFLYTVYHIFMTNTLRNKKIASYAAI